jgi:hypothetical protein
MATNSRMAKAAVRIGTAAGRVSGKAARARKTATVAAKELRRLRHNAQKAAAKELRQLSKAVDRMKRDLEKASKRLRRSLG